MGFYAQDLEASPVQRIEHNLGSFDLVVTIWQNGFVVLPNVQLIDEQAINVYGTLENARIVIAAQGQDNGKEAKRSKTPASTARSKGQSTKSSS